MIADWARMRGVEIVQTHTDLDQSGRKLSRPGLDAAWPASSTARSTGQTGGMWVGPGRCAAPCMGKRAPTSAR